MGKNGFWIALSLLAVVAGGIAYLLYQDSKGPAETSVATETRAFPDGLEDLARLTIERPGEPAIVIEGTEPAQWKIVEPAAYGADPIAVGDLVGVLRSLEPERTLEVPAADAEPYGLHAPMLRLRVREGAEERVLLVGGVNPTGTSRYARIEGRDQLMLVGMATVNSMNKSLGDLRQKKVLDVSEYRAERVRVESPTGVREVYRKDGRDWTFTEPEGFAADQRLMSEMVTSMLQVRADPDALNRDPLSESRFRAMPLYARVNVTSPDGEVQAELRGEPGATYASSDSISGIYPVAAEFDNYLRKPVEDFRDLRIFRFGFADVFELSYEGPAGKLQLRKPNENWLREDRKVDAAKANKLVDELRSSNATAFLEGEAPGDATHTVRLDVADGREEIVRFYAGEDSDRFAVRSGERGYYKVSERFLKDLDTAAGELLP
jgi:hypothetical protein